MKFDDVSARAALSAFAATQATIRFKPDGTIIEANDLFLDAMEVAQTTDIAGRHHSIFVPPPECTSEAYRRFWRDIGEGVFQQGEFCRRTLKGNDIWIAGTYTPVRSADGDVVEVIKFAIDVTERRQAVNALTDALIRLAAGDITVRLDERVGGRFEGLRTTFNDTASDLEKLIRTVMGSTERVSWSSEAMQDNAAALSRKTEEQAEALQSTASTLKRIAVQTRATSDAATEADERAKEANLSAARGSEIVRETIEAIGRIEDVTREVTKITKVIEGFAFQTNLLSINAAVEAARAGEAGKGFAVVATEVRSLAQRSAEASKNIGDLTRRCETDVANGARLAGEAGEALSRISSAVDTVVTSVKEIASASRDQASGLSEVENSTATLEASLQALSGLSGEGAKHAATLAEQLQDLNGIVEHFSTRSHAQPPFDPAQDRRRRAS